MNRHVLKDRRNGETTIHTLVGVSGGVSFDAGDFVNRKNLQLQQDVEFTSQIDEAIENMPVRQIWWWD